MGTKFYQNGSNLALSLSTTITASNEDANFPASNITDPRTTKVWKSTSGTANIVLDFGSALAVDTILVIPSSLTSPAFGYDSITIEAHTSDVWTSPSFSTSLTPNSTFGFGFKEFTAETYRYWRLTYTVSSGNIEVSKLFIGSATTLTTNGIDFGWSFHEEDRSRVTENRYGQRFVDVINDQKAIAASIKTMNKAELDIVANMFNSHNAGQPLWIVIDTQENNINDLERTAGYFYLKGRPKFINKSLGLYDTSFNLEEAL